MKRTRRLLCMVLVIALSLGAGAAANAAAPASVDASYYLDGYSAYIDVNKPGNISIWFCVYGTDEMDDIGATTILLYEKAAGSSTWKHIKTYSCTEYTNMLGHNVRTYGNHVDYNGSSTSTYKASVTVWAAINGIGSSRTITAD